MGNLRQSQTEKTLARDQSQVLASRKPTIHPMDELQGIIGNRALGNLIKSQPDLSGQVHRTQDPLLNSVSPVSGQSIQRMPMFRGLSHELMGHWQQGNLVQAKLTIGEAGDKYELEADRVASEVVRQINAPVTSHTTQPDSIQAQGQQDELMRKPMVQLMSVEGGMAATPELESSIQQAKGSGMPIAESIRKPMEQSFGADFSGVRVHSDTQSDQLNQSIQARAFTTGKDIFFRQGEYNPGSRGGQELIAHELTHVVQQTGSTVQRQAESQGFHQGVIQRAIVTFKPPKAKAESAYTSDEKEGKDKAKKVDDEVEKAFNEFKTGNYDGASEAQKLVYFRRKQEYDEGKKVIHPSTAAGYVIEGKANVGIKALGSEFETQNTTLLKGTRPDVAIKLSTGNYALVDITAQKSAGHILDKKGNWTGHANIPYVAESIYPSINFDDPSSTKSLSDDEVEAASKAAEESAEAKRLAEQEWRDQQEDLFNENQKKVKEHLEEVNRNIKRMARKRKLTAGWKPNDRTMTTWLQQTGLEVDVNDKDEVVIKKRRTYDEQISDNKNYKVDQNTINSIEKWRGSMLAQLR
ncbi:hypothetical protein BJP34_24010 [Moorena producens PAL-8-15-08-1]|uniref:eCIS core domain-containing protein n=1 Tax=Moorena producens PAL-8-15-08-1 TaxID=1458985 RepID=A0A1D8TWR6_9CYAN|nr:DUF4157 domain-containing protein [Moorena producens]AOX02092.1 hypothetical protein BJP34_24010 [Moorena producens PAL-8-15-08-1]